MSTLSLILAVSSTTSALAFPFSSKILYDILNNWNNREQKFQTPKLSEIQIRIPLKITTVKAAYPTSPKRNSQLNFIKGPNISGTT